MNAGERLRNWRKENKISAAEMAKNIGISQPGITQYETGKNAMSDKYLIKLNEVYGISLDWLLTGSGSQSRSSLPEDRKQLLDLYDQMTQEHRNLLMDTAEMYVNRQKGNEQQSTDSQMAG